MKKMLRITATLLLIFAAKAINAQTATDTMTVVGGRWIVCADTALKKSFDCTAPYSGFEFLSNGTYREYPKTIADPNKKYLTGKWTLNKNEFTIDQDDEPGSLEMPKTYLIVWSDKNHFYSSNKDGKAGPPMYVYFQRVMR